MREFKKETEEVEKQVVTSAKCDWCGKEFLKDKYTEIGTSFCVWFGWGSRFDADTFYFDICDDCFEKELEPKGRS